MTASPRYTDAADTWNRRYAGDDFLFGTEPNAWLRAQAGAIPAGGRVLCVADGEGRNSVWLARQGFQVEAFDIAGQAIAKARRLAAGAGVNVDYALADCDGHAWQDAAYDGVVAIFVQFADPALRERLFERIVRSLRPGGVLLLQGYTPRQLEYRTGGPPQLEHLYTRDLLEAAFAGLEQLELREYEAEIHEGSGHHGRSALIGLVARRPRA
jgi:2-polyprenyl-3-methyl-5-hydroxy-6-metoxy-1,4-benzoquinol methylase